MKISALFILLFLQSTNLFSQKYFDWHKVDAEVNQIDSNQYQFDIIVIPDSGWSLVSPFSRDSSWVQIKFDFKPKDQVEITGQLLETPPSAPSLDTLMNKQVNFISTKTVYSQTVKIKELPRQELSLEVLTMPIADNRSALPPMIWKFNFKYIDGELKKMKTRVPTMPK